MSKVEEVADYLRQYPLATRDQVSSALDMPISNTTLSQARQQAGITGGGGKRKPGRKRSVRRNQPPARPVPGNIGTADTFGGQELGQFASVVNEFGGSERARLALDIFDAITRRPF